MNNSIHLAGATFYRHDITQSAYADFVWTLNLYDVAEDGTETAQDLSGVEFAFTVYDMAGDLLETYTPTIASNAVTVEILLEDWADWRKNCNLTYRLIKTGADNIRFPMFSGNFHLTS